MVVVLVEVVTVVKVSVKVVVVYHESNAENVALDHSVPVEVSGLTRKR